jgi:carboxyl-terminal processing protease
MDRVVARDHFHRGISMPRRNFYLVLAVALVSFICYQRAGSANRDRYESRFETFSRVMQEVQENYLEEVGEQELFENALEGMVEHLDPYSGYIPPRQFDDLQESLHQEFGGIGIQVAVDQETGRLTVMSPLFGTPAYRAGIQAGDVIVEIAGESTEGFSIDDAVDRLRGKPGEEVSLKVAREGQEQPLPFTLQREIISVPTVLGDTRQADDSWDYFLAGHPGIGYVRITSFGERTTRELKAALEQLEAGGMRGLIVDLRDNPGGLLDAAVEVSDLFVESGTIVTTRGRGGSTLEAYAAGAAGTHSGFPLVVLTNGYSASASEIVAACLQDHGRATIVGERTFGKGSVQDIIPLEDGSSALKLTIASYWRPSGHNIHRSRTATPEDEWGVMPNTGCEVVLSTEEYGKRLEARRDRDLERAGGGPAPSAADDARADPQLLKAIEVLEGKLSGTATAAAAP